MYQILCGVPGDEWAAHVTVKDADTGEGILLNTEDPNFNFISYRGVYRPISNGSVVLSYMVYSSYNNSVDDIVERYDFVIK